MTRTRVSHRARTMALAVLPLTLAVLAPTPASAGSSPSPAPTGSAAERRAATAAAADPTLKPCLGRSVAQARFTDPTGIRTLGTVYAFFFRCISTTRPGTYYPSVELVPVPWAEEVLLRGDPVRTTLYTTPATVGRQYEQQFVQFIDAVHGLCGFPRVSYAFNKITGVYTISTLSVPAAVPCLY